MTTRSRNQSQLESDDRRAIEALHPRVRAAIASARTSSLAPRHPIAMAIALVPFVTAGVVMIASGLVFGRQGVGLNVAPGSGAHLMLVLLLLIATALVATAMSLMRGRRGLGASVSMLVVTALSVAPTYAALVLLEPVHAGEPVLVPVPISPWGFRCA